jgi:hypothetical protein
MGLDHPGERVVLLLLTAALAGLLVPYIHERIACPREREQRELDTRRAREESLGRARETLLDDVGNIIIAFHDRAAAPAWYKTTGANPSSYACAVKPNDTRNEC